ncbi:MAG: tetratricopeptide repeat protein [Deltaproteobacteria bacterium]|nr:tetratricopeptide repeat protein [Deltaproteobacteria bacterium]
MSLIKKMFGLRSFEELKQSADALFAAGDFGAAKIEYERAKERSKAVDAEAVKQVIEQIDRCRDALAETRIAKALDYLKLDERILALSEVENALDIAASDDLIQRALEVKEKAEREDIRNDQIEFAAQSDEDRYVTIAGSWEDEQAEEYENYEPELRTALLALDDNRIKEARERLETLLQQAKDPHYLYFEVGKARLMDGDLLQGVEAMRVFLSRIGPDEGGDMRLMAHTELARIANEARDFDAAVAHLQEAVEAMPKDPRPYLLMGNFLRQQSHLEEAIAVLEAGLNMMVACDLHPDWRLIQEIGLSYADLDDSRKAVEYLEQVVGILVARQHLDLPPESAVKLAQLHEKAGNKARAADLYALLAHGSDTANYFRYYQESGRLLAEIGVSAEARRALQRALELAPDNNEIKETIRSQLEATKEA